MAAILCTTIGDLLSKACTIPCKACGGGCDKLGELMCTPFMPYLVVTFFLNTPAVVYAVKSVPYYDCSYSLFRWLVVNAVLSIIHMIAAFYIVRIIREPAASSATPQIAVATVSATTGLKNSSNKAAEEGRYVDIGSSGTTSQQQGQAQNNNFYVPNDSNTSGYDVPGGANSFQRIKHVLCYDKGMAVYIVIFLFWIVWMGIGVGRRLSFDDNGGGDCEDMMQYMNFAIAIGYVWMSMVGMAFCCSLCCLR